MVGRTVGNYEILSLIGRGGMGEVWKARDTRLGREVAIKMLPEQFAQDRERIARLEREAQVLASLNHPGIAAIYGFEEFDDMRFLVLEFVVPAAAGAVPFDLSNLGLLAYVGGAPLENNRILALVDREGRVEVLNLPPKPYLSPRMLPDGNQLAVQVDEDGRSSIWVYELSGETQIRELTPDSDSVRPVWSADSERVTFASIREDKRGIFWQPADGGEVFARLTTAEDGKQHWPESWSSDGQTLSFAVVDGEARGLWMLSLADGVPQIRLFYDEEGFHQNGS